MKLILTFLAFSLFFYKVASSQALSDGEYLIKINETGKFFAIAGASKDNNARLIQWDNEYASHFKFIIKHLGGNVYSIIAKHSGRYLSTEGTPIAGAKLVQWDWLNQDNQKWYIQPQNGAKGFVVSSYQNKMKVVVQHWNSTATPGNGAYFFLQGDMNMRPMILDFKKNETTQIEGNQYKDMSASKMALPKINNAAIKLVRDVPDGIYKIYINQSKKYLAIAGQEDMNNGMRLIQWDMLSRNNHLFEIRKQDNGGYTIKPVHSQKVLDVVDMRTEDGTQVQQWDYLNTPNQLWKFYNETDGVSIVSVATGKKLQLATGVNNVSNGTPLVIASSSTQTFQLYPARAVKFTDYITIKDVRFTVPHGGDLDMFGMIEEVMLDKHDNGFNEYYQNNKEPLNVLFARKEAAPINMDKLRLVDLGGEVKLKIGSEELVGAKINIVYGINENDADVASPFTSFGTAPAARSTDPRSRVYMSTTPYKAGGSDDFYQLKNSFNDKLKSKLDYHLQQFFVADIPMGSTLVHVNLQDEDGSDNWLDVYFTVIRERK
jgi:hypothetical protein